MGEPVSPAATDWGLLEPLAGGAAATSDDAVLEALVDVERALVRAWGRLAGEDLHIVADALRADRLDRADLLAGTRAGGVPVIPLATQLRTLAETAIPGSGVHVHAGVTSQDVLDSALVLMAHRALTLSRDRLVLAGEALAALAEAEKTTLAIARTLGQHAAQSTVGVTVASWLDGVTSAIAALDATGFPVQLGGAVGTGEDIDRLAGRAGATDELRAAFADDLGLVDPGRSWHTERSPILAIAASAALIGTALGRIGHDVAFLARTEIGEVGLAATGGSSAMPHKRNPVDAVLLHANGLRAAGLAATVHTAALSQDARPAGEWHAEWAAFRGLVRLALESADAAASMLPALTVDRAAVDRNRSISPDLQHDPELTLAAAERVVTAAIRRFQSLPHPETP
ncbi:lyase family protein [Cryobacterium sp. AP23]